MDVKQLPNPKHKSSSMVKTYESRFPPSPNLDKAKVNFDKLKNTDVFLQLHGV